jgi:hypothetical protein
MMMKVAPALLLLLPLACSGTITWTDYSSPEGKYSVLMPSGTPKDEVRTGANGLTIKAHGVEVRNGAYLAAYADLPALTTFDYGAAINAMAGTYQGKVLSQTDFTLDGFTGKTFEMEIAKPKGFASGRILVANGRLYQIVVMGTNARASDADVQKFLGSFKLTK